MKPVKKSLISLQEVIIVWLETTKKGSTIIIIIVHSGCQK